MSVDKFEKAVQDDIGEADLSLDHFPRNPAFGTGIYRRLVRIARGKGHVLVTLDDTHHSMWLLLEFGENRIRSLRAAIERGPATPCGSAAAGLQALIGYPLHSDGRLIAECLPATSNCTHLVDLARLAIAAAQDDGTGLVEWRISVPDLIEGAHWVTVERNGLALHRWRIRNSAIEQPESLAGRPVMRGFYNWAREAFRGESLQAAIMLQRGIFVSRGRRHFVDAAPPVPLRLAHGMAGVCHSYSDRHLASATSIVGYVRDFSDGIAPGPLPASVRPYLPEDIQHAPA